MKGLLSRGINVYRSGGLSNLLKATKSFARSGELRYKMLGLLPRPTGTLRMYIRPASYVWPNKYTDADPFKILWVDPDRISDSTSKHRYQLRRFGKIKSGDWDHNTTPISDDIVYTSFESHFCRNTPWPDTEYYNHLREKIESGKHTRVGTSVDELHSYFFEFDELYNAIKEDGYRTQRSLLNDEPETVYKKNMDAPVPSMNEIGICIGRDGQLIHSYRGKHRLIISKLADVDAIAVQVLTRHHEWQSVRNRVRNGGIQQGDTDLYDHPDLINIVY